MRKIAFSCLNGSSDRTKACVSMGVALAARGSKTLIIDADPRGQTARMLGVCRERGTADVIDRACSLDDVAVTVRENLWLISVGQSLTPGHRLLEWRGQAPSTALADMLEDGSVAFDYVVLNAPPLWDKSSVDYLNVADELILRVDGDGFEPTRLRDLNQAVRRIRRYRPDLTIRCAVPQPEASAEPSPGPAARHRLYQFMTLEGTSPAARGHEPARSDHRRREPRAQEGGLARTGGRSVSASSRATAWRPLSGLRASETHDLSSASGRKRA